MKINLRRIARIAGWGPGGWEDPKVPEMDLSRVGDEFPDASREALELVAQEAESLGCRVIFNEDEGEIVIVDTYEDGWAFAPVWDPKRNLFILEDARKRGINLPDLEIPARSDSEGTFIGLKENEARDEIKDYITRVLIIRSDPSWGSASGGI